VIAVCSDFAASRTLFVGGPGGILRSTDAGRSFECVLEVRGAAVRSLAASPDFAEDGTVFAAFDNRLYRSVDRGGTWDPLFEDGSVAFPRLVISPAFPRDETVFLGGQPGLWRSHDRGTSWQPLLSDTVSAKAVVDGLAISPFFERDRQLLAHVAGCGLCHSS